MKKNTNSKADGFLNFIEKVGNKLPHPATLFLSLCIITAIISAIGSILGWEVTYQGIIKASDGTFSSQEVTAGVNSLINVEGIQYVFANVVTNFTGFAPLGTVLVALVGISIAEHSGLISTLLRKVALGTPERLVTTVVIFLGVMSNAASDAGYVVLPPLAGLIFISFKRHPIAGVAAAFSGISGGFSANLIISSLDPLLAGFTQEASRILDPTYVVTSGANWYFMAVSTFLIVIVGTLITEKIVEPRLGAYKSDEIVKFEEISEIEKKALKSATSALIIVTMIVFLLYFILGQSLFLSSAIIPIIVMVFAIPGIVYGVKIQTIKSDEDVMGMIADGFKNMSNYLVLVFFASQFLGFFNYSNMGTLIAVKGAEFLKTLNAPTIILLLMFIIIVAFINLFMGSSSAKWAILAPVFVPMLMQLGITPEASQLAYRIGDSSTNLISPLMSYFPMMVVFMQKYDKKASIGTLISTMLPYSIAFLISWSMLLFIWFFANLPIGTSGGILLG